MARENGTFGPTQKGFNAKNPTTWSRGFRELMLDRWFKRDPNGFTAIHDTCKGLGAKMLSMHQTQHPKSFARQVKDTLAEVRPETE